jgi:hypothetical protein
MAEADSLSLSGLIVALREDILGALAARPDGFQPMFKLEDATVEVAVEAREDSKVKGGLKLFVVNIGAEGSEGSTRAARLSLRMSPIPPEEEAATSPGDWRAQGPTSRPGEPDAQ